MAELLTELNSTGVDTGETCNAFFHLAVYAVIEAGR
jgi:hypothetical protein